jgi:hypothetical protein
MKLNQTGRPVMNDDLAMNYAYNLGRSESFIRILLGDFGAPSEHDRANARAEREVTRRTVRERCEAAAATVDHRDPVVIWCHLNAEGDLLEALIPDAIQVSGADSDEAKEEKLSAFTRGEARVLVTKPVVAGWGLNWQHCAHVVYFPTHSHEQYYQAVRRCWRFGQTRPVVVDLIRTDGDARVLANLQRKATAADKMFADLVAHMNDAMKIDTGRVYDRPAEAPAWL